MKTETGRMDKQKQYEMAKPFLIFKCTEKQRRTSFGDFWVWFFHLKLQFKAAPVPARFVMSFI